MSVICDMDRRLKICKTHGWNEGCGIGCHHEQLTIHDNSSRSQHGKNFLRKCLCGECLGKFHNNILICSYTVKGDVFWQGYTDSYNSDFWYNHSHKLVQWIGVNCLKVSNSALHLIAWSAIMTVNVQMPSLDKSTLI